MGATVCSRECVTGECVGDLVSGGNESVFNVEKNS